MHLHERTVPNGARASRGEWAGDCVGSSGCIMQLAQSARADRLRAPSRCLFARWAVGCVQEAMGRDAGGTNSSTGTP